MILKYITFLLVSMFLNFNIAYANVTAVVLNFGDHSSYSELNTDEIMDQLLIDRLLEIKKLSVCERQITKASLEVEQELFGEDSNTEVAYTTNDFNKIFNISQNNICFKKTGDYLPFEKTRMLGERYNVDYIIHGTIDFIGGKERGRKIVWDNLKYGHSSNSVTVLSTLRIIESNTGKIVWCHQEKGKVKDKFDSVNNFSYGTKDFSNHLFYEALDEISEKMIKQLYRDLDKGVLSL